MDICIDYDALESSRAQVETVISSLERAGTMSSEIAGLVGYQHLASKVETFADGWDINRGRLIEELGVISDSLQAVVDAFTDLDQQMAETTAGTR